MNFSTERTPKCFDDRGDTTWSGDLTMLTPKYRDVFSCPVCERSESRREEFKCNGCGSNACEHLVLIDGGMVICFCCYKDDDREWPDYTYTMVADKEKSPEEP